MSLREAIQGERVLDELLTRRRGLILEISGEILDTYGSVFIIKVKDRVK